MKHATSIVKLFFKNNNIDLRTSRIGNLRVRYYDDLFSEEPIIDDICQVSVNYQYNIDDNASSFIQIHDLDSINYYTSFKPYSTYPSFTIKEEDVLEIIGNDGVGKHSYKKYKVLLSKA